MISAREIAAWRAFAPWSNDVQVEQDYLLCKAVAAIFEDKFLSSQVAMRGGTVLHKGHLAPAGRYSEDIDLVRVGDRPASHLKKALTRVLRPLLGEPSESIYTSITLAVRNLALKSKIIRSTYIYDPWSPEATFAVLRDLFAARRRRFLKRFSCSVHVFRTIAPSPPRPDNSNKQQRVRAPKRA